MSIESLLEDSIIADFRRDPVLVTHAIRKHDYGGTLAGESLIQEGETSVIVVTATDEGEFKMGSGIRSVAVAVQVRVNGEADGFNGTLLDDLSERVRFRLMPSPTVYGAISGRENVFSVANLLVYGITNGAATQRIDSGFERIRIIPATFIAAQV